MKKKDSHNNLGFQVPDGYFKSLEKRLLDQSKHAAPAGFETPVGYFETLETRFEHLIKQDVPVIKLQPQSHSWLKPLLAIAAVLAVICSIYVFTNQPTKETVTMASIDNDELMEYLLKQPMLKETETLSYLYASTDLPENETLVEKIEDDELVEYLMNNTSDNNYLD